MRVYVNLDLKIRLVDELRVYYTKGFVVIIKEIGCQI